MIVHVVGPEKGLTQPGMTICCGDSHTATHGAFGCIAMGIGTSQVRDVLASQTLAMDPLKVRRILVEGDALNVDVTAIINDHYGDTSRMFCVGKTSVKLNNLYLRLVCHSLLPYLHQLYIFH